MSNLLSVGKTFSYLIWVLSLSWLMIDEEDLKQDLIDEEDLKMFSINKMEQEDLEERLSYDYAMEYKS